MNNFCFQTLSMLGIEPRILYMLGEQPAHWTITPGLHNLSLQEHFFLTPKGIPVSQWSSHDKEQ